jgi:hypothetical protein
MTTVALIPPDPTHDPPRGAARRALLYPLWVLRVEIKPFPGTEVRTIHFSVDGVRNIPLPIRGVPETSEQAVPPGARLLQAVPEQTARDTTLHFARQGLGALPRLVARTRITEARTLYKLYWIVDGEAGTPELVDSRAGTRVPLPSDLAGPSDRTDG